MSPSKASTLSLNPLWPHYIGLAATLAAVIVGLLRYTFVDWADPSHCAALLSRGSWLDRNHQNWQPEGCMLHGYKPSDCSTCLSSRSVVFIGDSVTRKLFFQFANIVDSNLPTSPPDDQHKHTDHVLHSKTAVQLSFIWDPFLNTSRTRSYIAKTRSNNINSGYTKARPALLVLGSGLWYLRYADTSGGLPAWEANIESILDSLAHSPSKVADGIVLLPVEKIVSSKLSHERATSMRPSDIEAMNSDLYHRVNPPSGDSSHLFSSRPPSLPVSLPLVFNDMLDPSQTEDGLHFFDPVIKVQANVLLNLRCNDVLPKRFPLDKTCCRRYPTPSILQILVLAVLIVWGPYTLFVLSRRKNASISFDPTVDVPAVTVSIAVALIYIADRTGFWLKEQKQFDPWTFAFLTLSSLAVGLGTMKQAGKDLGFLNRNQTDEWKGWMQIAILIYHYTGSSKISGIYNPIRALVASYLFMTGYGHTTYYIRKEDFSFLRVAQVMVRINFLTIVLAYTMSTDYISYYFAPLVSMWFLIIYGTFAIGSHLNGNIVFLLCKLSASAGTVTWFMKIEWPLRTVFRLLEQTCGIHWSAREWGFRVNLDLWIVYVGMLTAIAVIKIREHRLADHPRWALAVKTAVVLSTLSIVWFLGFELLQESKFTYNLWHPYISFVPVLAFAILRNSTTILRSANSVVFSFVGRCSLETFIIQYHIWLAADTKGLLIVIPGTKWRAINFVVTTAMFIYLSHRLAQTTGVITAWICGGGSESLPLPATANPPPSSAHEGEGSNHAQRSVDDASKSEVEAPAVPGRRWVDRLAEGSSPQRDTSGFSTLYKESIANPGVKSKLAVAVVVMWVMNVFWPYP